MKRPKNGYTRKQYAYAQHSLSGKGKTKKEAALLSGFSPSVALKATEKIERTEGYANAMAALASETGNVALKVLHTLKHKNLENEDTRVLLEAVTVLASAWDRFTPKPSKDEETRKDGNMLRAIFVETVKPKDAQTLTPNNDKPNPLD